MSTTVTVAAPASQSASQSSLGFSYVFAPAQIETAMADALDVMGLPIVGLRGSFEGSGSDVMRVEFVDGIGFELPMTALASETDAITPSNATYGYTTVTLAQYGLAFQDTYKVQLLARQPALLVDYLVSTLPKSYVATVRSLVCAAGATFASGVGAATTPLSIDDLLDLSAARRQVAGAKRPTVVLHGLAISQAIESARQEPAYQQAANAIAAMAMQEDDTLYPNFLGLGFDVAHTNDVTNTGGGYVGFACAPGGIGFAGADPSRIKPAGLNPIKVPNMGLLIEDIPNLAGQSIRQTNARVFLGVAIGAPEVYFQRKVTSRNT